MAVEWHGPICLVGKQGPPGMQGEDGEPGISLPGPAGAAGATGSAGAAGRMPGLSYLFNTATSSADPGSGKIAFDTATLSAVSAFVISGTDHDGNNVNSWINAWDDSSSTALGYLVIRKVGTPTTFIVLKLTGHLDNTSWHGWVVTSTASGGAFSNGDSVDIEFSRTGDRGDVGATGSPGANGGTGAAGRDGPPGFLQGDDGEPSFIPGPPGPVTASIPNGFALSNGYITATVAGNALTIAIKTAAGADPSTSDKVTVQFRDATAASGVLTTLTLTAATSLVVSSGSTLGVISATPFRLWVVGFNDAGTFRLGVVLLTDSTMNTVALRDYILQSSTAEGGAGGADSAQVIYTGTAATSKPSRILGWLEYETLATAGTWGTAPFKIHQQMFGDPLPGELIQTRISSSTAYQTNTIATVIPFDDSIPQSGEGDQYFSQAITPSSKANVLECEVDVFMFCSVAGAGVVALFQDSTAGAFACCMVGQSTGSGPWRQRLLARILPGTTSSTTIKMRGGQNNAGAVSINGLTGRLYGGVHVSFLSVKEIMG